MLQHPPSSAPLPAAAPPSWRCPPAACCSRRAFLQVLGTAAVGAACADGGDAVTAPPLPVEVPADAIARDGATLVVRIARVPALAAVGGAVVVDQARVLVARVGADAFRAFSGDCPHAGCLVTGVEAEAFRCPCHGSRFGRDGRVLNGPADRPLTALPATFDGARGELRVALG